MHADGKPRSGRVAHEPGGSKKPQGEWMVRQATRRHRPPARGRPDRPSADRSAAGAGQRLAPEGATDARRAGDQAGGEAACLYTESRPAAGADNSDDDGAADRLARGETPGTAT